MLPNPGIYALNHLLGAEAWARDKLKPYAGQCVEFRNPPLPVLRLVILDSGLLANAAEDAQPNLVVTIGPGALAAFARGDDALMREIGIEGNADLASTVQYLFRHLRWDVEEDLSRISATRSPTAWWSRAGASPPGTRRRQASWRRTWRILDRGAAAPGASRRRAPVPRRRGPAARRPGAARKENRRH